MGEPDRRNRLVSGPGAALSDFRRTLHQGWTWMFISPPTLPGVADVRLLDGRTKRIHFATYRLKHSRWVRVVIVPNECPESLVRALLACIQPWAASRCASFSTLSRRFPAPAGPLGTRRARRR
jgi:hypothetical protein